MKLLISALLVLLLASGCAAVTLHNTTTLWPKPANLSYDSQGDNITISPCNIKYVVSSPGQTFVEQMINYYLVQVFKCIKKEPGTLILAVVVRNTDQFIATDIKNQKYELLLAGNKKWQLNSDYYAGFLRGLQTFSQLFERNQKDQYIVRGLPITVEDAPQFLWRGLMIDTSRHFLPVQTIKKALDSMMYSKLNILHWHIVDQDSFPMKVPTVLELSQSGSIAGVYSETDIKAIISYAKIRGIRVVPEIDTPAHTQSWGRSQKYKSIVSKCDKKYNGQLNPTLDLTWEVLTKVLTFANVTFIDDYMHLGGDEVSYKCWNTSQINDYIKRNNISGYEGLSVHFRQRQKKLWRSFSKRKVIYWANQDIDLPLEEDDVIQWWGVTKNVNKLVGRKNQVILANYDLTYLDLGFGSIEGGQYETYTSWRKMYSFQPRVTNVNVIGAEVCMWNELGSKFTFEQKVTQRSSVIAERLWNDKVDIKTELRNVATRLAAHAQRLRERGFKVWPVTVGLCQVDMSICF